MWDSNIEWCWVSILWRVSHVRAWQDRCQLPCHHVVLQLWLMTHTPVTKRHNEQWMVVIEAKGLWMLQILVSWPAAAGGSSGRPGEWADCTVQRWCTVGHCWPSARMTARRWQEDGGWRDEPQCPLHGYRSRTQASIGRFDTSQELPHKMVTINPSK